VNSHILSAPVLENGQFIGFLDISPTVKGHGLLIPKEHYVWIQDTPDNLLGEFFITSKKIIKLMIKGLKCHRVELIVDGIKMSHFHAHLIPRWIDDGLPEFKTVSYENEEEKQKIVLNIKNN
jgi:histidine triad (HIT) family protein